MTRKISLLIIPAVIMTACATYQPKPGDKTARIRFVTYVGDSSSINVQDPNACPEKKTMISQVINNLFAPVTSNLGMLGSREVGSSNSTEVLLPADQKLLMTVGSRKSATQYSSGYSCYISLAFNPKPDGQYEIQYKLDLSNKKCTSATFELSAGPDGSVLRTPVPSLKQIPSMEATNLCSYR